MNLNSKKVALVGWGTENENDAFAYQVWFSLLKKIFPKIERFDTKKNYFQFGKKEMNEMLLDLISRKNLDLVIFFMENDEIFTETLEKIRKISPKTKLLLTISDDDARFDNWSIYYSQFFDQILTSQSYVLDYKKLGIKNVEFHLDYNTYLLEPLNLEKKYDVVFIGRPKADRNEILKYLLNNKVNVKIFGGGWEDYSEFKEVYGGIIDAENYPKIINEAKINLVFSKAGFSEEKNHYNIKGRFFETALCKSFQLTEFFPEILKFFRKDEIGLFKSNEELLEKINYYLNNEKERNDIAEKSFKRVLKEHNREKQLIAIFNKLFLKPPFKPNFFRFSDKVLFISSKEIRNNVEVLKKRFKGIDYISFCDDVLTQSKFREYFHIYSLKKMGKPISCCDYYLSSEIFENYLLFSSKFSFKRIGKKATNFIFPAQLMVKKDFFISNIIEFRKLFFGKNSNIINESNTSFISLPLISIKKYISGDYEEIKKCFEFRFMDKIFSAIHKNNFLNKKFIFPFFLISLRQRFILRFILEFIRIKSNWYKLSINSPYLRKSLLKKFIFLKTKSQ